MPSTHQLPERQIRCMEKLPEGHKMVNTRHGAPIVRRPDGVGFENSIPGSACGGSRAERR